MQEITELEQTYVSGSGILYDTYSDLKGIVMDFPSFFDALINTTVEVACRISGDC